METTENMKEELVARATEIDSGAARLNLGSAPMFSQLSLDPATSIHGPAKAPAWSLAELVGQRKLIATKIITTANTAGDTTKGHIWSFRHTFANVLNDHMREMKSLFRLFSWKLHFCFQFRSNFQQVGQLVVVQHHIPKNLLLYLTGYEDFNTNQQLHYMLPHVKVPMGEDVDVEAEMVWNAPVAASYGVESYKYTSERINEYNLARQIEHSSYDMGSISVFVSQTMEIAQGVNDNMTCRIWSWLTDVKYGAYAPTDDVL